MGKKEDDHNRGQEDGAKADFFDQLEHLLDPFHSEHYHKGFQHGVDTTLEKDPLSDFFFSGWSDSPKTEERREEGTSNDSQYTDDYDDDYDDDYNYSSAYSSQHVPAEPEPKPEPIVHTTYRRTTTGLSVSKVTFNFETEEEKAKYLRQEALLKEMLGDEYGKDEEDPEQERLARIVEQIESGSAFEKLLGVLMLASLKEKE
jgi:hypothetical protein